MQTSRTETEGGFTLLELLACLAILAIAAVAVIQVGRSSVETARARSFLVEAEAMMRHARSAAIESSSEQDVLIDTIARRLVYPAGGRELEVPSGMSLGGMIARTGSGEKSEFRVRFFPSGGSTGASLSFGFHNQVYVLRVNWLTGHADVRRS